MTTKWFHGREVLIVTMHGKEQVLAPMLSRLGLSSRVAVNFDTDRFGTFTGEIERKESPQDTLRNKLTQALLAEGHDLGIASEGSFGPHPLLPFLPAGEEWVLMLDRKNGLELWGHELTTETNYAHREVRNEQDVVSFANDIGFPQHGIVVRGLQSNTLLKDITCLNQLHQSITKLKRTELVRLETDMRAMRNPTRMSAIDRAGKKLLEAALSFCPSCQFPGFIVNDARRGLPCEICGTETEGIIALIKACSHCHYRELEKFPNGEKCSAQYCDVCNP